MGRLRRVQRDNPFDRPATDFAELLTSSEHDAIHLWAVIAFRFVVCPFEGAHSIAILLASEKFELECAVIAKQRLHFLLRTLIRTDFGSALPVFDRVLFEFFFVVE